MPAVAASNRSNCRLRIVLGLLTTFVALPLTRTTSAGAEEHFITEEPGAVLFAFDDQSIVLTDNLQLTLVPAKKFSQNPVLRSGPRGSSDYGHAVLYGSVLAMNEKLRMWYLGHLDGDLVDGKARGWWRPMCYAESEDGIHWTKPDLELVELNGNRRNNICLIEGDDYHLTRVDDFLTVLHDPGDPDPNRRYKSAFITHAPLDKIKGGLRPVTRWDPPCTFVCATSADGLRWRVLKDRPSVNESFEVSGLYRFGNFYYATGQQLSPWMWLPDGRSTGRVMSVFRSPDFVNWTSAKALGFARAGQTMAQPVPGQQTHMGAGMWQRGNVLVGLYGMWQDGPPERPSGTTRLHGMRTDLGLVVSNDGLHFREPVPDFKVLTHGGNGEWDSVALLQGHAFANRGEQTYFWYSHWDCEQQHRPMEIGLATLRRDGFGYLACRDVGAPGYFITRPLTTSTTSQRLYVNVDGVSSTTPLRAELLDEFDRPLPGYSGADGAQVASAGVRQTVIWPKSNSGDCPAECSFAVRVTLPAGEKKIRLFALYFDK